MCFGGLWTESGYRREIESPNSDLIFLTYSSASASASNASSLDKVSQCHPPEFALEKHTEGETDLRLMIGISCTWAIVDEAHITLLGVHPEFRRQGLGMLLMWVQFQCAYQRGMKRATLEVSSSNKGAIALYKHFGFKEAGVRKKYYKDTGEDALILWRGGLQKPTFLDELQEWKAQVHTLLGRSGWSFSVDVKLNPQI